MTPVRHVEKFGHVVKSSVKRRELTPIPIPSISPGERHSIQARVARRSVSLQFFSVRLKQALEILVTERFQRPPAAGGPFDEKRSTTEGVVRQKLLIGNGIYGGNVLKPLTNGIAIFGRIGQCLEGLGGGNQASLFRQHPGNRRGNVKSVVGQVDEDASSDGRKQKTDDGNEESQSHL